MSIKNCSHVVLFDWNSCRISKSPAEIFRFPSRSRRRFPDTRTLTADDPKARVISAALISAQLPAKISLLRLKYADANVVSYLYNISQFYYAYVVFFFASTLFVALSPLHNFWHTFSLSLCLAPKIHCLPHFAASPNPDPQSAIIFRNIQNTTSGAFQLSSFPAFQRTHVHTFDYNNAVIIIII